MMSLGIDFGTSTTVLAGVQSNKLEVIKDDSGDDIIASAIAFPPRGKPQIGKAARSRVVNDPANTLHSIKRILGKVWHSPEMTKFRTHYPFQVERDENGVARFETRAGRLTPEEVVARFLSRVREFDTLSSRTYANVVVAIPQTADNAQATATTGAVVKSGFPRPETVSEPAAAVLAYLYGETEPKKLLVYDLGGGTFDAAVVRWDGRRPVVLSAAGDSYLGGDDIDRRCADWVADQVLRENRWDIRSSESSFASLVFLCERAKTRLSFAEQTAITLSAVDEVLRDKQVTLTRAKVQELTNDLIDRTFAVCRSALRDVGMDKDGIDLVVLVGGSTYAPLIRARVREWFEGEVACKLPPDRVVAMGAALLAEQRVR